jgi:MtN3 and saliva related transmembrane protein
METIFKIFGYIGSFMLVILFTPQIYRTYKTKNVESISTKFLFLNLFTSTNWFIYGIGFLLDKDYINSSIILISNTSLLIETTILLYMVKIYSKSDTVSS